MIVILALILIPISAFTRALAGMWIFNWFAPVIYPGLHASYLQALAFMCLLAAAVSFNTNHFKKQQDEKELAGRMISAAFVLPFIIAGLFGLLYLCCILPFKS